MENEPGASDDRWYHYNPVRIRAGMGVLGDLPRILPAGRVLFLTSAGFTRRGLTDRILCLLGQRVRVCDSITPNPDLDELDSLGADLAKDTYETIVAVGGGSVIDAAKVFSVTLNSTLSSPLDHVLRSGNEHTWRNNLPIIACPTTSGTGAEVTPFATVWDHRARKKYSLTDNLLFPHLALLDPLLTTSLPYRETLYTGLDTLAHALESLWNRNRTPISCLLAEKALARTVQALPALLKSLDDVVLRQSMQEASLLAGLAISQTRTAIAHAMSYPLTMYFSVPHGLACSFTLKAILQHLRDQNCEIGVAAELLNRAVALLDELDLASEMHQYADREQITALRGEMMAPSRSDNFIEPVSAGLIEKLLEGSISRR